MPCCTAHLEVLFLLADGLLQPSAWLEPTHCSSACLLDQVLIWRPDRAIVLLQVVEERANVDVGYMPQMCQMERHGCKMARKQRMVHGHMAGWKCFGTASGMRCHQAARDGIPMPAGKPSSAQLVLQV